MKESALSEKSLYLHELRTGEGNLLAFFLFASLSVHLAFFAMQSFNFMKNSEETLPQELEIEASLMNDMDFESAPETAIPGAKVADEVAIRDNLLPQITKKFTVEEEKVEEEAIAEEVATPQDGNVEKKAETDAKIVTEKDQTNKIKKMDALKRLALEKLRQEKKDNQEKAPNTDPIAKVREELTKADSKLMSAGGSAGGKALDRYRMLLQKAIGRNYEVPEAYNFKNMDLNVVIDIKVNAKGELTHSLVSKSSGDQVFDELAFAAVKRSNPLPHPPADQAGKVIKLNFSPKSF